MHGRLCQVRIRARAKTKGMSRPLRAGRGCRFGFCVYIAGERWVLASAQAAGEHGSVAGDYEYIDSFACYGEFGNGVFDRMAESRREVWFGDDGSGLIRSQHIRSVFFTASLSTRGHPTVARSICRRMLPRTTKRARTASDRSHGAHTPSPKPTPTHSPRHSPTPRRGTRPQPTETSVVRSGSRSSRCMDLGGRQGSTRPRWDRHSARGTGLPRGTHLRPRDSRASRLPANSHRPRRTIRPDRSHHGMDVLCRAPSR
jgi:hypothetical protein